jgi:hypothetical protein
MTGNSREIEAGQHLKDQIDRYMNYRYCDAFIRDIGDPLIHVNCKWDPRYLVYNFEVETRSRFPEAPIFKVGLRVDMDTLYQVPNTNDRFQWLLYACQDILPKVDTGLFSCWFANHLPDTLQGAYRSRILKAIENVRLLPFNGREDKIDRGSLAVVYLRNGGQWRETIMNIEQDPEAFLANLLMLVP